MKLTEALAALDQQAKRRKHNYLKERYNCETKEILQLFALRGYTLRETADRLEMKYSTLKTQAWELGISFKPLTEVDRRPAHIVYQGKEYLIKDLAAAAWDEDENPIRPPQIRLDSRTGCNHTSTRW